MTHLNKQLICTKELSAWTGLSQNFFEKARMNKGDGPAYLKLGGRVFYDRIDVQAWLDSCRILPGGMVHD